MCVCECKSCVCPFALAVQPLLGSEVKQSVPEAGDPKAGCAPRASGCVLGVPCCFPDPSPSLYLFICWGGGGFFWSVSIVTSLHTSRTQSAFVLTKCGFFATTPASPPQSVSVPVSMDFSEPTPVGCLGLLCSRLKPHPGKLQADGGA